MAMLRASQLPDSHGATLTVQFSMVRANRTDDATRRPLYSVVAARQLTSVPTTTIKRWLSGYTYTYQGESRFSEPKVGLDRHSVDGALALSFRDLLEVRIANELRRHGFGWKTILEVQKLGQESWKTDSPFALRRLRTDGRKLFAEAAGQSGKRGLLFRVGSGQLEFEQVISPTLWDVVDFTDDGEPLRWWPLGRDAHIVVDPATGFGRPVVDQGQVPVEVLVRALRAEGSAEAVARMFRVSPFVVLEAERFRRQMAA